MLDDDQMPEDLIARVEVVFRPFVSSGVEQPFGPRGTEAKPYFPCIFASARTSLSMRLMIGPVILYPWVRYETDAEFLHTELARIGVQPGDRFSVPMLSAPLGFGRVVALQSASESGARALGDGRDWFAAEAART